jgi:hypothetical protein
VVGGEAHFVEDNHVGIATALHHLFGGGAFVDGEAALSGEGFPAQVAGVEGVTVEKNEVVHHR